ncbi:AAA family ATPase [Pseudomonas prosekii]|uniref:AAA domain-containing protein n=1 Tax=Pseudomonas prosekii TaxID=1148509 RepID=A0A1H2A6M3_9PSED|nr:AAA family ATPase [Pseudomonas prosekii]SDT41625.1 AAA domain-containing protein [Pseudomonas prosekii]
MFIEVKNCNNIDSGGIELTPNQLNIKYATNGTGKSTVAKAISFSIGDRSDGGKRLKDLTPFKGYGASPLEPTVTGTDTFSNLRVFDEGYINDFVFQPTELIKGSFDIFIRGADYEAGMQEIAVLTSETKNLLTSDPEISQLISDLGELLLAFGKQVKSGLHASSNIAKAFKGGNRVSSIPTGLEKYTNLIQCEQNYKWIKWQQEGKDFLDISSDCPYCTHDVADTRELILKVTDVYDAKSVESLNKAIVTFSKLDKYFSDETRKKIAEFITNIDGYSDAEAAYIVEVRRQIEQLAADLGKATNLGFSSLKNVDGIIEEVKKHKIDLSLYVHLNSSSSAEKIDIVNRGVDCLLEKAGKLQGGIAKQKILIEKLVKKNSTGINDFLRNAGYHYSVKIIEIGETYQLRLIHNTVDSEIENVKSHLSYGERNAFSLVLFMYDCLKSGADLVVLDDPISSFDKNKKYAIVDALFRKDNSFKDKTVLLLTHDFEPVVDMMLHHPDRFSKPTVAFLENKGGVLTEVPIARSDIKTFIDIAIDNAQLPIPEINRLVYLRRYYEITSNKRFSFDILSSLFHKRNNPSRIGQNGFIDLTEDEVVEGVTHIQRFIPTFDYAAILALLNDDQQMKALYFASENNYEKLHLYRVLFDDKPSEIESDVIRKFINEAFHIENNYIYQLNPSQFQLVPQYVIDECDVYVDGI